MNFEVYTMRDRHLLMALLVQAEAEGVTSLPVLRERLGAAINDQFAAARKAKRGVMQERDARPRVVRRCACGKGDVVRLTRMDPASGQPYTIEACVIAREGHLETGCGWSRLVP